MANNSPEKRNKKPKKKINPAIKYSGMGVQIGVTIFLGIMLGQWLDGYFEMPKPYLTILMAMIFLVIVMYTIIKDVSENG